MKQKMYLTTSTESFKKTSKAYSLLEIILAVAIIAVLSAIVIIAVNPAQAYKKTRDAQRYADIKALDSAIMQYIIDNDHAPYLQNNCSESNPRQDCFTNETLHAPFSWTLLEADLEPYLVEIPRDPCGEDCFKDNTYYAYNYYAPSSYYYACSVDNICGSYASMSADQAKSMYSVYAENLESENATFGSFRNQFQSY